MQLILHRTSATSQRYIETLEGIGETIPLQMIQVPAGQFIMGSPKDEPQRLGREGPQRNVSVPSFFMGRYPITQSQWRVVAAMQRVNQELSPEPSQFKGDDRPVEQVSWYEAVEFCDRLSALTQRPYRLPSEAEWEYACRAGTITPFHFGETLITEIANYKGSSTYADGLKGEYRRETTPVDHFKIANVFGLSDMHGNVWEWCQDHFKDYDRTSIDSCAWISDDEESHRILRGGSWLDVPRYCRSAYRSYYLPSDRADFIGFRVICSLERNTSQR